jgi:hypothetical protein
MKLATDLVQRSVRATSGHVSMKLTKTTLKGTSPAQVPGANRSKLKSRCAFCPRSKDRKSTHMCHKCQKYMCVEHVTYICEQCVSGQDSGSE